MKIPIVVTEKEYAKGEVIFNEHGETYEWVVSSPDEPSVADAVRKHNAIIVVLGVEQYTGELYKALHQSASSEKTRSDSSALIVRHGVGCDGIDIDMCKQYDILLANTPGTLDQSVAEHTMALLLSMFRNIPSRDSEMRAGRFSPKTGFELKGKWLGIAGLGNIGRIVAKIARYGFEMEVVAFDCMALEHQADHLDISVEAYKERFGVTSCFPDFKDFATAIDILSIHMPVTEDTVDFFNADRLGALKQGTYIINTSRGKLVEESALYDLLAQGHLSGAALDVYQDEPYVPADPAKDLRTLENTVLTPHIASDTRQSNDRMEYSIIQNIAYFLSGETENMNLVS